MDCIGLTVSKGFVHSSAWQEQVQYRTVVGDNDYEMVC